MRPQTLEIHKLKNRSGNSVVIKDLKSWREAQTQAIGGSDANSNNEVLIATLNGNAFQVKELMSVEEEHIESCFRFMK